MMDHGLILVTGNTGGSKLTFLKSIYCKDYEENMVYNNDVYIVR